ncbi:MAG: DUF4838 domain-containing protein [Muribaculaceae bacterium]|nr:DUF4838 domain-containing protein [Muribaculaceae bacterium]
MKHWLIILLTLCCLSACKQKEIRIVASDKDMALQLKELLEQGGCQTTLGGRDTGRTIYLGIPPVLQEQYQPLVDSLRDDGYLIVGDGHDLVLYGKGEKGTLYAMYSFLEMMGYRLYTPEAMVVPDVSRMELPVCRKLSNPAFRYREVAYYYPNHSQLYADWHHLHTMADRDSLFGMFVHTFAKLLPPSEYYDMHPEWYSLNNGRRMRDGQLCLSNTEVFEELCHRLSDAMSLRPEAQIWSVSPNDNYNVCECADCRHLDSLYGGHSGTLMWFVGSVARRFPDKTISTLAYQYTRQAPLSTACRPPALPENLQVMLCPIEVGREQPIVSSKDGSFRKDMEDWHQLTDNIFLWDYVVQFRNFWDPFPNLHVLQSNLQFFRSNGVQMMFEQGTGPNNVSSWMDIRCYMIAKLLWDPDTDMDAIMDDFYQGYYGDAGKYVKEIVDTMTHAVVDGGKRLDIYGYPVDAVETYLQPQLMQQYDSLMTQAYAVADSAVRERLRFFQLSLDFARVELEAAGLMPTTEESLKTLADDMTEDMERYGVAMMMEMGITPRKYYDDLCHYADKAFYAGPRHPITLRYPATAPYASGALDDGRVGILDYRHDWLGFWGDTLDAIVALDDAETFNSVSLDFYFYPLSWIFLPQRVVFYVSDDMKAWRQVGEEQLENPEILATPSIHTVTFKSAEPIEARYLRIVAEPFPEIPSWHRAAGEKPWIFTDEVFVK